MTSVMRSRRQFRDQTLSLLDPALETPRTILVADDHEASLVGLAELLSAEGFNVVTARDGQRDKDRPVRRAARGIAVGRKP
jgi:PleD family two-component response regulator